jgi:hypothetical protein
MLKNRNYKYLNWPQDRIQQNFLPGNLQILRNKLGCFTKANITTIE